MGPAEQPQGSHLYEPPRRRLRWRVLDWVIGAVGMLAVLALGLLLFWLSITRPSDEAAPPTIPPASQPASPSPAAGPPAGLGPDEVWLGDIALSASSVVAAETPLHDVVGIGTDVVAGPNGLIARHFDMTATVPFSAVAPQLDPRATLSPASGGEVRVDTWMDILGRSLPVGATGTVEVVGGKLVIVPTSVDLQVPQFISNLIGDALRELIRIEYEIEGMPDGVVLRSVNVVDSGFRANLTGDNVRLVQ